MGDKAEKGATESGDVVSLEELLPAVADLFHWPAEALNKTIGQCDVVLDTNVLLFPYVAGKQSLEVLKAAYARLVAESRLFVPARVVREFAVNRPSKLHGLLKTVMDQRSRIVVPTALEFPLLTGLPAIERVRNAEKHLRDAHSEYVAALDQIHDSVLAWGWGDPVSLAYRETFSGGGCIVECGLDKEEIEKQRDFRFRRKIPPGYKDSSKPDGGVGDLIIWFTILQIARARKRDLVFVTGDEKADWQHRVNNRGFLPRVELVDEYRRTSEGRSLFIVPLSELLSLLNTDATTVATIRKQEAIETDRKRAREQGALATVECPHCRTGVACQIGERIGDSALPTCPHCGERFHVNRVATGLRIRAPGARRSEAVKEMTEWFEEHYEDPANGVPLEAAEGGYQYINGGPFDAHDALTDAFSGQYPDRWIAEASARVEANGTEWVRRGDY